MKIDIVFFSGQLLLLLTNCTSLKVNEPSKYTAREKICLCNWSVTVTPDLVSYIFLKLLQFDVPHDTRLTAATSTSQKKCPCKVEGKSRFSWTIERFDEFQGHFSTVFWCSYYLIGERSFGLFVKFIPSIWAGNMPPSRYFVFIKIGYAYLNCIREIF